MFSIRIILVACIFACCRVVSGESPSPDKTLAVDVSGCPVTQLVAALSSIGIPCDLELDRDPPSIVDSEGRFLFHCPIVKVKSDVATVPYILNLFVLQNPLYTWSMSKRYGFRVYPKSSELLTKTVDEFSTTGTLDAILKHPAMEGVPFPALSRYDIQSNRAVAFPGGTMRDALSCWARSADGAFICSYNRNDGRPNVSLNHPPRYNTDMIQIRYDAHAGEVTSRDLIRKICSWSDSHIKGGYAIVGNEQSFDTAIMGAYANERPACEASVAFLRALLAADSGHMKDCVSSHGFTWMGKPVPIEQLSTFCKEKAVELEGVQLGDVIDVGKWRFREISADMMRVSVSSKRVTGPLSGELIFICEKSTQTDPKEQPFFTVLEIQ